MENREIRFSIAIELLANISERKIEPTRIWQFIMERTDTWWMIDKWPWFILSCKLEDKKGKEHWYKLWMDVDFESAVIKWVMKLIAYWYIEYVLPTDNPKQ